MHCPLSFLIALRYGRAKSRNRFISFISLASVVGIALGVMVLITVLSVMNGFDAQIRNRIFDLAPQLTIRSAHSFTNWENVQIQLKRYPQVTGIAPFISGMGVVSAEGRVQPVLIYGIDPAQEKQVSQLEDYLQTGELSVLQEGSFKVFLGEQLADNLGAAQGSMVTVMTPQVTVSLLGIKPLYKRVTVGGIFHAGGRDRLDEEFVFLHWKDAQKLLRLPPQAITGLRLKLADLYQAPALAAQLRQLYPYPYIISDWTAQYGQLFSSIRMEKNMMFLILALIIAVAGFNLVSMLVMVVNDKRAEIAILRTLGMSSRGVFGIFIGQGMMLGLSGALVGLLLGVLLSWNVTEVVLWLQHLLGVQFISDSVYWVDYLPSLLLWRDVAQVTGLAVILSFLATLYPAFRASRVQPLEGLRYE